MSLEAVPVIYFGEQRISRLTGTSRNACQSAFMCDADKLGGPEEGRDTGCVLGSWNCPADVQREVVCVFMVLRCISVVDLTQWPQEQVVLQPVILQGYLSMPVRHTASVEGWVDWKLKTGDQPAEARGKSVCKCRWWFPPAPFCSVVGRCVVGVEAQMDASILLGHIASNAPGLICFSLFSEPAEPHGGQTGTWAWWMP